MGPFPAMTPPPQTYRVALIQLHPRPLSPSENFSSASSYIRRTASQGAQLAVLPEYHLTSWLPSHPSFLDCCSDWQTYLEKYRDLAKELSICIVPGTILETHPDPEKSEKPILLNAAYFISNDGSILHRYLKRNLWHPERPYLSPSPLHARHTAFDTPIGRVGLLICWDLAFPEAFRELIADGAKTIIVPTFWTLVDASEYGLKQNSQTEALFLESLTVTRAYENTCAVVFVNAGAKAQQGRSIADPGEPEVNDDGEPLEGSSYAGMSRVCLPFVGALGKETKDTAKQGMSIVDVNMRHVQEAEKCYKIREDMDNETWHYEYRHTKPKEIETKAKL